MAEAGLETYLERLRDTGLFTEKDIHTLSGFESAAAEAERIEKVGRILVQQKRLTPWQEKQLRADDPVPLRLGQYVLLGYLGAGGMSRVYLAQHIRLKRRVAIKILPSEKVQDRSYLRRFLREARALAQLDHPNIVRAFNCDAQGECHYLAMEYVAGTDLERLIRKEGPLSPELAANYIRQAAQGLAHAHARGQVHRDVKPGNLLLDKTGTVKLLDLGLARLDQGLGETSVTLEFKETVIGTVDFMPPEQALDSHTIDHRADIYSLGYTLYFLLVGKPPFPNGTLAQRLLKHQTVEPPLESEFRDDVPKALIELRQRMTAKDREQRFATMQDVVDALLAFERGEQATKRVDPPAAQPSGIQSQPVSPSTVEPTSWPSLAPSALPPPVRSGRRRPADRFKQARWLALGGGGLILGSVLVAVTLGLRDPGTSAAAEQNARVTVHRMTTEPANDTGGGLPELPPIEEPTEPRLPGEPSLIISEYVEGPSHNKAIELFNASDQPVALGEYALRINGFNTSGRPFFTEIRLNDQELPPGGVYVIMLDDGRVTLPGHLADQRHGRLAFNGDDSISIWHLDDNRLIDLLGVIGQNPNGHWYHNGVATRGQTLVRKPHIRSGNPEGFRRLATLSEEWIGMPQEDHSLGEHAVQDE